MNRNLVRNGTEVRLFGVGKSPPFLVNVDVRFELREDAFDVPPIVVAVIGGPRNHALRVRVVAMMEVLPRLALDGQNADEQQQRNLPCVAEMMHR
jgi:hypothetical protein